MRASLASAAMVVLASALAGQTATPPLPDGGTTRTVAYRTVGPLAIRADIFRPAKPGPHPVVLWIHGGALVFGDRGMLPQEQRERYLRAGLAVVSIDYRLAPETKLDGILEDLDAAHAWLQREGGSLGLDPRRLAVVGHSAGGYLALMAGVRFRPRPLAVVSFYGYGDVAGPWYSRPDPGYLREAPVSPEAAERAVGREPLAQGDEARRFVFYRYARQRGLWPQLVAGHDPDREPRAFDPFCPARNVAPDFPPTLLLHGDRDADVPHERSLEMARALRAAGVPHELHRLLPGEARVAWERHAVAKPEVEPFTFRETKRVAVRPAFTGDEAFLLTLLRARSANEAALAAVRAERRYGRLAIRYTEEGRSVAIDWDLARRTVSLETRCREEP